MAKLILKASPQLGKSARSNQASITKLAGWTTVWESPDRVAYLNENVAFGSDVDDEKDYAYYSHDGVEGISINDVTRDQAILKAKDLWKQSIPEKIQGLQKKIKTLQDCLKNV